MGNKFYLSTSKFSEIYAWLWKGSRERWRKDVLKSRMNIQETYAQRRITHVTICQKNQICFEMALEKEHVLRGINNNFEMTNHFTFINKKTHAYTSNKFYLCTSKLQMRSGKSELERQPRNT